MASRTNPDLYRCQLCRHGRHCRMGDRGVCGFAHALRELLPPDESRRVYDGVWSDGVHRWYGQAVDWEGVLLFEQYYYSERLCDIPVWAHGLRWYLGSDSEFDQHLPSDFGLRHDWAVVCMHRKGRRRPFDWAEDLWELVETRTSVSCTGIPQGRRAPDATAVSHSRKQIYNCHRRLPVYVPECIQENAQETVCSSRGDRQRVVSYSPRRSKRPRCPSYPPPKHLRMRCKSSPSPTVSMRSGSEVPGG